MEKENNDVAGLGCLFFVSGVIMVAAIGLSINRLANDSMNRFEAIERHLGIETDQQEDGSWKVSKK